MAVASAGAATAGLAAVAGTAAGRAGTGCRAGRMSIERLDAEGLLPAITFIFSRAGCDAAVQQCLQAGLRLTTPDEAAEISEIVRARTAGLDEADRLVLGYADWVTGLRRGIAAHHAGLLPTFKEVVEELFEAGLIRAVFATETLALGINMPARTVVIEKLDKWNGEHHADLTAGEYTQLTGRAGRRGIDVEGHAVVLWQPDMNPIAVAGLAGTRTYPLNSSFQPTYNMAVNLVGQVGRARAAKLLESSFAQFQADRGVVGLARQAGRLRTAGGRDRGQLRPRRPGVLRRDPARARPAGAGRGAAAVGGPAGRGDGVDREAAAGRHHRRAGRPRRPASRRAAAGRRGRRTSRAAGADDGPPGETAVGGRLPGPGQPDRADQDPALVQPALAGGAARPGVDGAEQDRGRRTCPGAQRGPGRSADGDAAISSATAAAAQPSLPRLPRSAAAPA